jgi:hypothetical protein
VCENNDLHYDERAGTLAFGARRRLGVVDCIDEKHKAEHVNEKNQFLVLVPVSLAFIIFEKSWEGGYFANIAQRCAVSLTWVGICAILINKSRAAIHSFILNRVSLRKPWRCVTRRSMTYLNRWSTLCGFTLKIFLVIVSMITLIIRGGVGEVIFEFLLTLCDVCSYMEFG